MYTLLKQIKSVAKYEDLLEELNYSFELSDNRVRSACPIHKGKNSSSFVADNENHMWYCHSQCKHGGDIISFVMETKDLPFREAVLYLASFYNIAYDDKELSFELDNKEDYTKWFESLMVSDELIPYDYKILNGVKIKNYRGLNEETLEYANVLYFDKYEYTKENKLVTLGKRIVFPIFQYGILIGVSIRDTNPNSKFKWIHQPKHIKMGNILYNYDNAKRYMQENNINEIIVVEGILDALAYIQLGFKNVVAIFGTNLSYKQEIMLLDIAVSITLSLDNDDAGNTSKEKIKKRLLHKANIYDIVLHVGKDPLECYDDLLDMYKSKRRHR